MLFYFKGTSLAKAKKKIHHYVFSKNRKFSVFSVSFFISGKQYVTLKSLCICAESVKAPFEKWKWAKHRLSNNNKNLQSPVLLHTHSNAEQGKGDYVIQFSISTNIHSLFFYLQHNRAPSHPYQNFTKSVSVCWHTETPAVLQSALRPRWSIYTTPPGKGSRSLISLRFWRMTQDWKGFLYVALLSF